MQEEPIPIERFGFPDNFEKIFKELYEKNLRPVVVGGVVRDMLLGISHPKDIDVEVYGTDSLYDLVPVLKRFGRVSLVGESFGVCKLATKEAQYDFSLPRRETKTAKGHKGFVVETHEALDFCEASARRDFTINAMGYDPSKRMLLDCHGGMEDLRRRVLRAVDLKRFGEDPLRVLRGVVFASRFGLKWDENLWGVASETAKRGVLEELPKERVFEEIKKLFLQAKRPSKGIINLRGLGACAYFGELYGLPSKRYRKTLLTIDALARKNERDLAYYFAAAYLFVENYEEALRRFSDAKMLHKKVALLRKYFRELLYLCQRGWSDFDLKLLAKKVGGIKVPFPLVEAFAPSCAAALEKIRKRAEELGVWERSLEPKITGKELVKYGLRPSATFKAILDALYIKQLKNEPLDEESVKRYIRKFDPV